MKKKMSICFFVGLFIGILIIVLIQTVNQSKMQEKEEQLTNTALTTEQDNTASDEIEEAINSMKLTGNEKYYLKEEEGYLTVYDVKTNEVFCETNIQLVTLPQEIREKVKEGFYFSREKDLYDFLESYSS